MKFEFKTIWNEISELSVIHDTEAKRYKSRIITENETEMKRHDDWVAAYERKTQNDTNRRTIGNVCYEQNVSEIFVL